MAEEGFALTLPQWARSSGRWVNLLLLLLLARSGACLLITAASWWVAAARGPSSQRHCRKALMTEKYPGLKDMKKKTDGAKSGSNVTLQLAVSALAHSLHNS